VALHAPAFCACFTIRVTVNRFLQETCMMTKPELKLLLLAAACCIATELHASILNGSFETGDLSGWMETGGVVVQGSASGIAPTDGVSLAFLHATEGLNPTLKQSFTANAGDILKYDLAFATVSGPSIGSSGVWNLDNGMVAESLPNTPRSDPWSQHAWRLPTSGNYEVRIHASAAGDAILDYYVDNFRLVPEPATGTLCLGAVVAMAGCRMWRQSSRPGI
jgi:hypothetical protein